MTSIREEVVEYVHKNSHLIMGEVDINHVIDLAESVVNTRDKIMSGGSFVHAIVNNDLQKVIEYADNDALRSIKLLVLVKLWCHPACSLPF